jgi:hypothetical protein
MLALRSELGCCPCDCRNIRAVKETFSELYYIYIYIYIYIYNYN